MTDPKISPRDLAILQITHAFADAIRTLGEVPSGHLYARVMDKISLENFNTIIGVLVKLGQIEQRNHLLIWKGARP